MLIALLPLLFTAVGEDWPQFRGPGGNAVSPSKSLPSFDLEKGVRWQTPVPAGPSSPCIHGDRIFLTGHEGRQLVFLALDRGTGEILWKHTRASEGQEEYSHSDSTLAMPTPCTDGERVFFYFGTHGLIACDLDGEVAWEKRLPVPAHEFGTATSPVLVDDLLVLARDGCPDTGIFAFSKKDGSEVWSVPRVGFIPAYSTPYVWEHGGEKELIVAGTGRVQSLDITSGKLRWEVSGLSLFMCPSPVGDEKALYYASWTTANVEGEERTVSGFPPDMEFTDEELADSAVLFKRLDLDGDGALEYDELRECRLKDAFAFLSADGTGASLEEFQQLFDGKAAPGANLALAIAAGGAGDITESHVRWTRRRGLPYVSSPLLYEGRLYFVKAGGLVSCLDPETGEPHFERERLGVHGEYYATPIGVAGHVIVCSSSGTMFVLRASDDLDIVREIVLGGELHATPAFVGETAYVRVGAALVAFEDAPQ